MFGTLIVELPCTYQGAKLSVFDPEDGAGREQWAGAANENPTHEYCWAGESEEGIRFTAFYADCFHCVDTLTSGSRVALNYCLLSLEPDLPKGKTLSDKLAFPDAIPPQPARTGLIDELADAMTTHFFRCVPLPAAIRPHERHPFPTVTTTQRGRRGAVPTPLLRCAEPPICEWGGVAGQECNSHSASRGLLGRHFLNRRSLSPLPCTHRRCARLSTGWSCSKAATEG